MLLAGLTLATGTIFLILVVSLLNKLCPSATSLA